MWEIAVRKIKWPPKPFATREAFLMEQYREIWKHIDRTSDISEDVAPLQKMLKESRTAEDGNYHLMQIGRKHSAVKDDLCRAHILREFGIFTRPCLDRVVKALQAMTPDERSSLFPMRFLCADFDNLKGVNTLCGNDYEEANKVIAYGMDVFHFVIRWRSRKNGNIFPDGIYQYQRGDEIVLMLPGIASLEKCESIGTRVSDLLQSLDPIQIMTESGQMAWVKPSFTCKACEVLDPEENIIQTLGSKFLAIKKEKDKRKELSEKKLLASAA